MQIIDRLSLTLRSDPWVWAGDDGIHKITLFYILMFSMSVDLCIYSSASIGFSITHINNIELKPGESDSGAGVEVLGAVVVLMAGPEEVHFVQKPMRAVEHQFHEQQREEPNSPMVW